MNYIWVTFKTGKENVISVLASHTFSGSRDLYLLRPWNVSCPDQLEVGHDVLLSLWT